MLVSLEESTSKHRQLNGRRYSEVDCAVIEPQLASSKFIGSGDTLGWGACPRACLPPSTLLPGRHGQPALSSPAGSFCRVWQILRWNVQGPSFDKPVVGAALHACRGSTAAAHAPRRYSPPASLSLSPTRPSRCAALRSSRGWAYRRCATSMRSSSGTGEAACCGSSSVAEILPRGCCSMLAPCSHPCPLPRRYREINAHLLLQGQPRVVKVYHIFQGTMVRAGGSGLQALPGQTCCFGPPTPAAAALHADGAGGAGQG